MRSISTVGLVSLFTLFAAAAIPPSYKVTDLGSLGGGDTQPRAINSFGQIVGGSLTASDGRHAFLWSNDIMTDLGCLGGDAEAASINDAGDVVGTSWLSGLSASVAYLYHDGVMAPLPGWETTFSEAAGISSLGHICGTYMLPDENWHPYILDDGGVLDFAPTPGTYAVSKAINSSDWVTGVHVDDIGRAQAFLYRDGNFADLGTLGGPFSYGWSINDSGQIAGTAFVDSEYYYPVIFANGSIINLSPSGLNAGDAFGINNLGEAVGEVLTDEDGYFHGFIYSFGVMYDVNHYLRCADRGWLVEWINAINDAGQMVGVAHRRSESERVLRGVLLTPSTDSTESLPGDLNLDGVIMLNDVAILLSNYGLESGAAPEQGDLDGDGDVDLNDLAAILMRYGTTCS